MIPVTPLRVLLILELTEAYAQAILHGVCRRGGQDPRLRLQTVRLFPLEGLAKRLAHCDAIIASLVDQDVATTILSANVPVVNVSNRGTDFHPFSVVSDTRGAFMRSLQHFRERSITRFATIGKVEVSRDLLEAADKPFQYLGSLPYGEGLRLMDEESVSRVGAWLRETGLPMGVFCRSDTLAAQLAEICERNGLSVPEDVAIVGSGNDEVACLSAHPTLSSVDMHFEDVGGQAVELLFELLEGQTPDPPLRIVPSGSILVRQSSNVYAVDDPYVAKALKIMDAHLTTTLDIGSLADMLHISRRMFEGRFQKAMHMAPASYLRNRRLRAALEMLETSNLQITEIAYAAGFANAAHFCTLFRKTQGMTPKQYREKINHAIL